MEGPRGGASLVLSMKRKVYQKGRVLPKQELGGDDRGDCGGFALREKGPRYPLFILSCGREKVHLESPQARAQD